MKKLLLIVAAILLCGAAICDAEDRDRPGAAIAHIDGAHRGEGGHGDEHDRDHRHRPTVLVVGVPIFVGPAYAPYYAASATDLYQTIDGFWYYCADPAGYYPAVQDCPNGWRLVL